MTMINILLRILLMRTMLVSGFLPVHFWLYTKDNLDIYEDIMFDGETVILDNNTLFDPRKPSKVVVHGWGGGTHIDKIFANAYAMAGLDYNIIGVDWRDMEGTAQEEVVMVGVYTAQFLHAMVEHVSLELEDVHPVGWSYGAHVVANIGKEINRLGLPKLRRLTLLDPGEYGFLGPAHQHQIISKDDADYVDVIHTDGLGYGFLQPLGHADFYPNGGVNQPCSCDHECQGVNCSTWGDHGRAPAYFQESIMGQDKFLAWRCSRGWVDFVLHGNKCSYETDSPLVSMGEWSDGGGVPDGGVYYLTTHTHPPYSCQELQCGTAEL